MMTEQEAVINAADRQRQAISGYVQFCVYAIESLKVLQAFFEQLQIEMEQARNATETNKTEPVTTADYNPDQDR